MHSIAPTVVATGLTGAVGRVLCARSGTDRRWIAVGRMPPEASRVRFIPVDLRERGEIVEGRIRSGVEAAEVGRIEGVVHLAGVAFADEIGRGTYDEWETTQAVNLRAALALTRAVRPWLTPGASVVLVGSVDAWLSAEDGPAAFYGAAKAGLIGLARHLAAEWGPAGIRVNVVAAGALAAGMGPEAGPVADRIAARTALRRLGRPEEVADAVDFLLSAASAYITGAVIPVDGGLNLGY